jgi:hypothetical protein
MWLIRADAVGTAGVVGAVGVSANARLACEADLDSGRRICSGIVGFWLLGVENAPSIFALIFLAFFQSCGLEWARRRTDDAVRALRVLSGWRRSREYPEVVTTAATARGHGLACHSKLKAAGMDRRG